jgi:hypothetical protein
MGETGNGFEGEGSKAAHDEFMISVRRANDRKWNETEKKLEVEKHIKQVREEMKLKEKDTKRRKHGGRNVKS